MKIIITNDHFRKFNIRDVETEIDYIMNVGDSIDIISFLPEEKKHEILTILQKIERLSYIATITDKIWFQNDGDMCLQYSTKFIMV